MKTNKIITLISILLLLTFVINAQYKPDATDEAALKVYAKRIESNPKDFDAYFERGKLYNRMLGKTDKETSDFPDKAIKDFTKAIELDQGSIKAYLERAKIYRRRSETRDLSKDYIPNSKAYDELQKTYRGNNKTLAERDEVKAASLIKEAQDKTRTANRKYSDEELTYCPAPKVKDYFAICTQITFHTNTDEKYFDKFTMLYEQRMWEMSCAFPDTDSVPEATIKINRMWNKHKLDFKCDALGFNVPQGNVLKYAISSGYETFIETIVESYGLDINFKDNDGKTVLDFVNDEIKRRYDPGNSDSTRSLRHYKELLIQLGAKTSVQ